MLNHEIEEVMKLAAPQLSKTGSEMLSYITEKAEISEAMVAALLSVSERTLGNWSSINEGDNHSKKFKRIVALYNAVEQILEKKISSKQIINVLTSPIPNDLEENNIIHYIVTEPETGLLHNAINQVISDYQ